MSSAKAVDTNAALGKISLQYTPCNFRISREMIFYWICMLISTIVLMLPSIASSDVVFSHMGDIDPVLEGWGKTPGDTGAGVVTEGLFPDPVGNLNAWVIHDTSTSSGTRLRYEHTPTSDHLSRARSLGWTMRTVIRVDGVNDLVDASIILEYSDGLKRYIMIFGSDADGDPIVQAGATQYTSEGVGSVYQEYEMIFNPVAGSASVRVNGVTQIIGYTGVDAGDVATRFNWGSGQSNSTGRGHYHIVEWATATDSDVDGIPDTTDNCPYFYNDQNVDSGGVGTGSPPNGIGDACECGDLTGDGFLDASDLARYRAYLADPEGAPLTTDELFRCSVNGEPFQCDILSAVILARALAGEDPGVLPRCAAATGFGAKCGDGICTDFEQECFVEPRGCQQDCGPCLIGMACVEDADCASGNCISGTCAAVEPMPQEPRCGDGICNGKETCSKKGLYGCYDDCGPCLLANKDYCLSNDDCDEGICGGVGFCDDDSPAPLKGIRCTSRFDCDPCYADPDGPGCDDRSWGQCDIAYFVGTEDSGFCSDFTTKCTGTILGSSLLRQDVCDDGDLCRARRACQFREGCGSPSNGFEERCDNGQDCLVNDDCKSQCVYVPVLIPKVKTTVLTFCAPGLYNGVPCLFDEDCLSNICQGVCIGNPQPEGTPCLSDSGCASGNCVNGFCIPQSCGDGECQEFIENCLSDGSFVLGLPGQPCQADCGKCEDGLKCGTDADCASGGCDITIGTTDAHCGPKCGDGLCAPSEGCGASDTGIFGDCNTDCGLCGNGRFCGNNSDCASGLCNFGTCTAVGSIPNGDSCVADVACASGICNFGVCIASPLLAGTPCTTDAACISGTCAGVCIQRCGDGSCDGTETCGSPNPLACTSDCGLCGTGTPCTSDGDCQSNRCEVGICVPMPPPCNDTGDCPNGTSCGGDNECRSNRCEYGVCVPANCSLPAQTCSSDNDCCGQPWDDTLRCNFLGLCSP